MPFQVSPGVNVTELDFTSIVPAAATSLAGISFPTEWGPANEPILIDTPKTFRETFGDIKEWNAANYMTALNFLSYTRGLLMVRAMGGNTVTSNANTAGITAGAVGAGAYAPNDEYDMTNLKGGFYARYAGEKGNSLAVSIGRNGVTGSWGYYSSFNRPPTWTDNIATLAGTTSTNDTVHIVVVDQDGLFTGTRGEVLERFEDISLHPKARRANGTSVYFKNVLNNESQYVKVGGALDSYDLGSDYFEQEGSDGIFVDTLEIALGDWETDYTFALSGSTNFLTVSLTAGAGSNYTGDRTGVVGVGYDKLADAEKIDVNLLMAGDINNAQYLQNLKGIVENRKDCILFTSCDVGKDGGDVNSTDSDKADKCIAFKNKIGSSSYVVVDSGYKRQFDPYNQVYRWVPLNGDTTGLVARTEANLDAWWSPAGYNRGILNNANDALAFNPNKTYRDRIYPKGINPIISEKDNGLILLGDRTALSKPSAFDRINVRRLFVVLEKAIATASKFSLFEFNDAGTRSRFVGLVTPYLEDVRARRGIIDFKVVCDEGNNTPERIDRNEFWADIYIKPNRSINFIQLNFIATRTGASFSEVGA